MTKGLDLLVATLLMAPLVVIVVSENIAKTVKRRKEKERERERAGR